MSDTTAAKREISLGFTKQHFPPGVHICQIYTDDTERSDSLMQFILSGLRSGERTSCFSDKTTVHSVQECLGNQGISCQQAQEAGLFTLAGTQDVYFQQNCFDPDRMLNLLRDYYDQSAAQGFPGARVIGEMNPRIQHIAGGSRLLEYESRVSLLLRDHPVTSVCQYDARAFDGGMIMDILKVHPFMVIRGAVVHNPFYMKPEEFFACTNG